MPWPTLELIEPDSPADSSIDDLFGEIQNVIYKATNQAFREYQKVLENHEKHRRGDLFVRCKIIFLVIHIYGICD